MLAWWIIFLQSKWAKESDPLVLAPSALLDHRSLHFCDASFAFSIYLLLFLLPYRIDFHFLFILLFIFVAIPLYSILRETDEYQHTCEEWLKEGKVKEKCFSRNGKNDTWEYSVYMLMVTESVCPAQIFPPSFRPIKPSKVSSFLYLETAQTLQTQPMKMEFSHLCSGLPHLCFSLCLPPKLISNSTIQIRLKGIVILPVVEARNESLSFLLSLRSSHPFQSLLPQELWNLFSSLLHLATP